MTEREARENARDARTVRDAVEDASGGKYEPPHESTLGVFRDDKDIHDRKTYDAAWREANR